jgi:hypothetical protein
MEVPMNSPVSQEELTRLAINLRGELFNYEDRIGSSRDFAELMNAASAMIVAILEPVEFRLSASPLKKTARVYSFPPRKQSIPTSLH